MIGLGSFTFVSLAEARDLAYTNRKTARAGGDPLAERRRARATPTFRKAADTVWKQKCRSAGARSRSSTRPTRCARSRAPPHGFRSSFRDWAAEQTDHPREVIETALAHVVGNATELAYARSDLFERRRQLTQDWDASGRRCVAPKLLVGLRGGGRDARRHGAPPGVSARDPRLHTDAAGRRCSVCWPPIRRIASRLPYAAVFRGRTHSVIRLPTAISARRRSYVCCKFSQTDGVVPK